MSVDPQRALAALRRADFSSTARLDSVWSNDRSTHVPGIHEHALARLLDAVERLEPASPEPGRGSGSGPLGEVVLGAAGAGKTHLMSELRHRSGDRTFFVLLNLTDLNDFWETLALSVVDALGRPAPDGTTQLTRLLDRLLASFGVSARSRRALRGDALLTNKAVDFVLQRLHQHHGPNALKYQDVVRAVLLLNASDFAASNAGYCCLQGIELDPETRARYRFADTQLRPRLAAEGVVWLSSLTMPCVLVIDQLDPVVAWVRGVGGPGESGDDEAGPTGAAAADGAGDGAEKASRIVEGFTGGLVQLFDALPRTLLVLSCLETTWRLLERRGLASYVDRFGVPTRIASVTDRAHVERLVAARLAPAYAAEGVAPPSVIWPFTEQAVQSALELSPRRILRACQRRIDECLERREVAPIDTLEPGSARSSPRPADDLDARFERARAQADPGALFDPQDEDRPFRDVLAGALECLVVELAPSDAETMTVETDFGDKRPALHARLRRILHYAHERETHFSFRAISQQHPNAVTARIKAAITASGIDPALSLQRHLVLIRDGPFSQGKVTQALLEQVRRAGGDAIAPEADTLRTLAALAWLNGERPAGYERWLRERRPASGLGLFRAIARSAAAGEPPPATDVPAQEGSGAQKAAGARRSTRSAAAHVPAGDRIAIGRYRDGGSPASIAIPSLARHVAILAGSGSGKTVLLRRLIEAAALEGIPAIVLDTNNDLARLGDAWPQPPDGWWPGDAERAARYLERAEVRIWTPRLAAGAPLALSPLPDFAAVAGDADELDKAVAMAAATLKPLVGASGTRGTLMEGVLVEALRAFAERGGGELDDFVALLAALPAGVSTIQDAEKLAAKMADYLKAARAKNPLLGGGGTPLDPGVLLEAGAPGRARVSVINFAGLPDAEEQQGFVNQLQMALFSWLKRHPEPAGRPLNGLLVMDEAQNFVPSRGSTPSSESTLALISQARKYGLGMVLATQQPKGLHNAVISNCATHLYGRMSSPAAIAAAREIAAAKGGDLEAIGGLGRGEFYLSVEESPRPAFVETPLCLTHHPANPLPEEAVVARAAELAREPAARSTG